MFSLRRTLTDWILIRESLEACLRRSKPFCFNNRCTLPKISLEYFRELSAKWSRIKKSRHKMQTGFYFWLGFSKKPDLPIQKIGYHHNERKKKSCFELEMDHRVLLWALSNANHHLKNGMTWQVFIWNFPLFHCFVLLFR